MTKAEAGRIGGRKTRGNPRLTLPEVLKVRLLRAEGWPRRLVAELFGISVWHVTQLTTGRRWARVPSNKGLVGR